MAFGFNSEGDNGKARSGRRHRRGADVKKAHLNGRVKPEDEAARGDVGGCAKLQRWLCGMLLAALTWEEDHCCHLGEAGMMRGKAAPTKFRNLATEPRCVVHCDDFTFVGKRKDLQRMTQLMKAWYQRKVRAVLRGGANDEKDIVAQKVGEVEV